MGSSPDDVQFNTLRNAIYHSARRGFFEAVNRTFSFIVVAAGTGAVANIGQSFGIPAPAFAAVAALAGLAQLVFDFGGRARTHEFLQRRFYELSAEVSECRSPTPDDCARWEAILNRLYAEEPPPMRALDAVAYNAAIDSLGRSRDNRIRLRWNESLFRHFWPFNGAAF